MAAKVKYIFNVYEVFDRAYSNSGLRSKLRPILNNPTILNALGREIVKRIEENTLNGKDRNGNSFKPYPGTSGYSKKYRESLIFKIYKGMQRKINLKLRGHMLSSMISTPTSRGLVIEFSDQTENDKAHGHINGIGKAPPRDFLGLSESEEEKLLKQVISNYQDENILFLIDLEQLIQTPVKDQLTGRKISTTTVTEARGIDIELGVDEQLLESLGALIE